jgi:exosome complex component RRP40
MCTHAAISAHDHDQYVPAQDELVVGVVAERFGESYRVDIGAASLATLSFYAFEGATKRNHPNLPVRDCHADAICMCTSLLRTRGAHAQVGSTVYARISLAHRDLEPELVCVSSSGKANGLGLLTGGTIARVMLSTARRYACPPPGPLSLTCASTACWRPSRCS